MLIVVVVVASSVRGGNAHSNESSQVKSPKEECPLPPACSLQGVRRQPQGPQLNTIRRGTTRAPARSVLSSPARSLSLLPRTYDGIKSPTGSSRLRMAS